MHTIQTAQKGGCVVIVRLALQVHSKSAPNISTDQICPILVKEKSLSQV